MRESRGSGTEGEGGAGDGDGAVEEGDSGVVDAPLAVPASATPREGGRVYVRVGGGLGWAEADGDGDFLHVQCSAAAGGVSATATTVGWEEAGFEIWASGRLDWSGRVVLSCLGMEWNRG
jgi:hypothetical protein